MYVNAVGLVLEVYGFVLILKSTKRLKRRTGGFVSAEYIDDKTGQPPPFLQSEPIPEINRTGIAFIMAGLLVSYSQKVG
jgi:hypothetical protein